MSTYARLLVQILFPDMVDIKFVHDGTAAVKERVLRDMSGEDVEWDTVVIELHPITADGKILAGMSPRTHTVYVYDPE